MSVNDEFNLDDDENIIEDIEKMARAEQSKGKKKQKASARSTEIDADITYDGNTSLPPTHAPKVRIMIDEVKGMSNFETVSPNGVVYKIKRGVIVEVPQEVVNALELCVMTHIEESSHPITGDKVETTKHFSAIPWRRM